MQIWMVAMLAVSAVLILRDMAKLVFTGRKKGRPVYDVYPQKEKIDRMHGLYRNLLIRSMRCPAGRNS